MPIFTEEQMDLWEREYQSFRDEQLQAAFEATSLEIQIIMYDHLNMMEKANRVFLYFAENGKVSLEALDDAQRKRKE